MSRGTELRIGQVIRNVSLNCPCCESKVSVQAFPPSSRSLYYPVTVDKDHYVSEWKWVKSEYSHLKPDYFVFYHCRECFYTDFPPDFMLDQSKSPNNRIAIVRDHYLKLRHQGHPLIAFLGEDMDYRFMNIIMALRLHLLAIFTQELIEEQDVYDSEEHTRDWGKLARLYLRLSWIYREAEMTAPKGQTLEDLEMSEHMAGVLTRLQSIIDQLSLGDVEQSHSPSDLTRHFWERALSLQDTYAELSDIYSHIKHIHVPMPSEDQEIVGAQENVLQFLSYLRQYWPAVPISDHQCHFKAAKYFMYSAMNDRYLSFYSSLKAIELASVLFERIQRLDKALECMKDIFKKAGEFRMEVYHNISITPEANSQELRRDMKKLTGIIERIRDEISRLEKRLHDASQPS